MQIQHQDIQVEPFSCIQAKSCVHNYYFGAHMTAAVEGPKHQEFAKEKATQWMPYVATG